MSHLLPELNGKQQQQPPVVAETSFPVFGWAFQRDSQSGITRVILIDGGGHAYIFPLNPIDLARFRRDLDQAVTASEGR